MNKRSSRIRGFTLIELLVVIAIIAILTGIIMVNFTSARSKARDSKRVSDLGQLQLTLALYFDRCNAYPPSIADTTQTNGACSSLNPQVTLGTYIAQIPTPTPEAGQSTYGYVTNGTPPNDYVLQAVLEAPTAPATNYLSGTSVPVYASSFYCGTAINSGKNFSYCLGPK